MNVSFLKHLLALHSTTVSSDTSGIHNELLLEMQSNDGLHALNKGDLCAMSPTFIPQLARCLYVLPNFFYYFWIQFNIITTASSPVPSSTLSSLYFIGSLACTHFSLVPQLYL